MTFNEEIQKPFLIIVTNPYIVFGSKDRYSTTETNQVKELGNVRGTFVTRQTVYIGFRLTFVTLIKVKESYTVPGPVWSGVGRGSGSDRVKYSMVSLLRVDVVMFNERFVQGPTSLRVVRNRKG